MRRREFLKLGAAAPAALGLGGLARGEESSPSARSAGQARNVIFLVSDGMSQGTLTFADQYLRWRDQRPSHWMALYEDRERRVTRALMDMSSGSSMVTDSAAASSSWGGGHRVDNGRLNVGHGGVEHEPLAAKLRAAGRAVGLVTTTSLTDATPAGFTANARSRREDALIADQYLERDVTLLLGGTGAGFDPERREDGRDHSKIWADAGGEVVRTREDLLAREDGPAKLLGLFAPDHIPYEVDRLHDPDLRREVPSLAEMTRIALARLSGQEGGFFLMVEGGRVDHAAHANDLPALLFDQIAFDDAIGVALDFQNRHPDTLVIVTTDHGNANPGFQSGDVHGARQFERISRIRGSFTEHITRWLGGNRSAGEIRERFADALDFEISGDNAELLAAFARRDYRPAYRRMRRASAVIGQVVANELDFSWIGTAHSADYVELTATGPGAGRIRPFTRNTELHGLVLETMGVG